MNVKRIICVFLIAVMTFTISSVGIFADENDSPNQDGDITVDAEDPTEGDLIESQSGPTAFNVRAKATGRTVTLAWDKQENETSNYVIYRDGIELNPQPTVTAVNGENNPTERIGSKVDITNLNYNKEYTFKVEIKDDDDVIYSSGDVKKTITAPTFLLTAAAGYMSVNLSWDPDTVTEEEGIDTENIRYNVYRSLAGKNDWKKLNTTLLSDCKYTHSEKDLTFYYDKRGIKKSLCNECKRTGNQLIDYKVEAVVDGDDETLLSEAKAYNKQPVRPMRIKVTTKVKKSLKSHDGKGARVSFSKGTTLYTIGYSNGKYILYYNGYRFRLNRISCKNQSAQYLATNGAAWYDKIGSRDYTQDEAESFVNEYARQRGLGSSTSKLIWASFYTQHVYIFTKSNGKWVMIKQNEIASGKAKAPTPTGESGDAHRTIKKKLKTRHGTKYWNCFSSYNALHGMPKKAHGKLGTPASTGCIRNANNIAQYIYYYCPKKTRLLIY